MPQGQTYVGFPIQQTDKTLLMQVVFLKSEVQVSPYKDVLLLLSALEVVIFWLWAWQAEIVLQGVPYK